MPDLLFEKKYWLDNLPVAGCDEAGRGPLAGPVVAAAVCLPINYIPKIEVDDSKKLNEKIRLELFNKIINSDIEFTISFKSNNYIDEHNILKSSIDAMNEAADNLKTSPKVLLIDGNRYFGKYKHETIVKGDSKSVSIAMASILAKVTRDKYMIEIDKEFPEYGFSKHKGYPTKKHFEAIEKHGTCKYHRESFLKKFKNRQLEVFS